MSWQPWRRHRSSPATISRATTSGVASLTRSWIVFTPSGTRRAIHSAFGHNRIEDVEPLELDQPAHHCRSPRSKKGVPATGVDGTAMSRAGISPAS